MKDCYKNKIITELKGELIVDLNENNVMTYYVRVSLGKDEPPAKVELVPLLENGTNKNISLVITEEMSL